MFNETLDKHEFWINAFLGPRRCGSQGPEWVLAVRSGPYFSGSVRVNLSGPQWGLPEALSKWKACVNRLMGRVWFRSCFSLWWEPESPGRAEPSRDAHVWVFVKRFVFLQRAQWHRPHCPNTHVSFIVIWACTIGGLSDCTLRSVLLLCQSSLDSQLSLKSTWNQNPPYLHS